MSYDYSTLNIGKLDYSSIRTSLVSFLKKYDQFRDYDFDNSASAISLFIDILSANTAYNGYYLHSVLTNSFPSTATTKRALYLNATLRGVFVADTVSARSTVVVRNTGGTVVPRLTPISAIQADGTPCYFYCLEDIPMTTDDDTVSIEVVGGKAINDFSNFSAQTKTLELPLTYDPTALTFCVISDDGVTKTYWTQIDKFSTTNDTNIFTVLNGPNSYYVTTNISGAAIPSPAVIVSAILSNGSLGNSSTITGIIDYPSVQIVSFTTPSGGRDNITKEYLKTYMPYLSATNDRIVTQTDYVNAIYSFMTLKGFTITKSTISVTVPEVGRLKIYIPDLPSTAQAAAATNELMTDYLATRKIAGITLEYGA